MPTTTAAETIEMVTEINTICIEFHIDSRRKVVTIATYRKMATFQND